MSAPIRRKCAKCGEFTNVSVQEKGSKKYICPLCRGEPWFMSNRRLSEDTRRGNEAQRNWGKPRQK